MMSSFLCNFLSSSVCICILLGLDLVLCRYKDHSPHVWAVVLDQEDHKSVAESVGLTSLGKVFSDVHEFRLSSEQHASLRQQLGHDDAVVEHVHNTVTSHPSVIWAEFQKPIKRVIRGEDGEDSDHRESHTVITFNDPSYSQQWHLVNDREQGHDINVTGVWSLNITGHGVTVAIVDDGLEYRNPEIQDNYNSYGSYDFNGEDYDPKPDTSTVSNSHGTRCAGLVAAVANNSFCGVGVAYKGSLSGIRLLDGTITDLLEAKSLTYKTHVNQIYSCSWGPTDDGKTVEAPGTLAQLALKLGTERGRHGYGSIFVFASGNGGKQGDNCNFDGYANSIYTVTIGAVDELDKKPDYAEECASKFAVTYSNGYHRGDRNIVTADLQRSRGCTSSFSGTSAAAPMAAGIIALALEVRPCLTWRDIQSLLVYTARPIDLQEVEWTTNGCGFRHSHQHGFGVLDAYRLTTAAQVWPLLPDSLSWSSPIQNANMEIPPTEEWMVLNFTVNANDLPAGLVTLEHVAISVTVEHEQRGSVVIDLISPYRTVSHLATSRSKDKSSNGFNDWMFTTVRCWGESPLGVWSVKVMDSTSSGQSRGRLVQWRLVLRGTNVTQENINERRELVESVVSNSSYIDPIPCPPPPSNVPEITFPESTSSNKVLQIVSAIGAAAVTVVLLHIILTFLIRRFCNRTGKSYLSNLPSVPYYNRQSSSAAEEEEVLLLPDLGVGGSRGGQDSGGANGGTSGAGNNWDDDTDCHSDTKLTVDCDRQHSDHHISSAEL